MRQESTQVGFRIRGLEPTDLSTYPDSIKLMFWGWVLKYGLIAKDRDLARGLDKDGEPMRPLTEQSIKRRKSEVGPTYKHAPPLEPSYARSRVRSLLTGRAHLQSCEFWWKFDSHSGRSFAEILRYQRDEYGRDVFGLSPRGTAWTLAQALKEWEQWKREGGYAKASVSVRAHAGTVGSARPVAKREVRGRTDLENFDLMPGDENMVRKGIEAGRFPGFRRLNARGEKWKPGHGLGPVRRPPPTPSGPPAAPAAPPRPPRPSDPPLRGPGPPRQPTTTPVFGPSPARIDIDPDNRAGIRTAVTRLLGRGATPQTAATLAGAPAGTTATVAPGYMPNSLLIYIEGPGISAKRQVRKNLEGKLVIENINVYIARERQGQGIGTEVLGRQIEAAARMGVDHLYTSAAGSPQDTATVGYKVWPKFGYDGELRDAIRWKLPEPLKHCKRISDLYATPAGRLWWEQNGESIGLQFDLTPGSYSMRVWNAYLEEQRRQGRTP